MFAISSVEAYASEIAKYFAWWHVHIIYGSGNFAARYQFCRAFFFCQARAWIVVDFRKKQLISGDKITFFQLCFFACFLRRPFFKIFPFRRPN